MDTKKASALSGKFLKNCTLNTEGLIPYLTLKDYAPSTIEQTVKKIKYVEGNIEALNFDTFSNLIYKLKTEGKSNSYLNNLIASIKVYAKWQNLDERLINYPMFKRRKSKKEYFTLEELKSFINLENDNPQKQDRWEMWTVFYLIMCYTGCRPNEARCLKIEDINFNRRIILFRNTKTHEDREASISDGLYGPLYKYVNSLKSDLLFFGRNKNKLVNEDAWTHNFNRRVRKLGIKRKGLTCHSLRHTFIVNLLRQRGVVLYEVMAIVGHKKVETTEQYYHYNDQRLREVCNQNPLLEEELSVPEILNNIFKEVKSFERFKKLNFSYNLSDSELDIKITSHNAI